MNYYRVADFIFSIKTISGNIQVRSFIPFEVNESAQTDFHIEQVEETCFFSEAQILGTYNWFESVCSFYRIGNRFIWNRVDNISGELEQIAWEGDDPKIFKMYSSMREHVIEHLVLIAFNFATLVHNALVIHSSVIENDGKGYVFLGESGTGKSTHAKLWLKYIPNSQILNDDAPLVRVKNGEVMVFGTPWSGKGRVFKNVGVPVIRIYRLSQAPYNKLTPLNTYHAFAAMVHSCLPPLMDVEEYVDTTFNILSEIIKRTPLFHLECLPNAHAVEVSCSVKG